jgi:hypothetical protein
MSIGPIFKPKTFKTLTCVISTINRAMADGRLWWLKWDPAGFLVVGPIKKSKG